MSCLYDPSCTGVEQHMEIMSLYKLWAKIGSSYATTSAIYDGGLGIACKSKSEMIYDQLNSP